MKKIILLQMLLIISATSFSQKTFFSIGPELALPASYSQSHNNRGTGFGGSLRVESSWSKHVSGMATISYLSFALAHPLPTTPSYSEQVNAMLVQVGLKYYTQERKEKSNGFFISAELGLMPTTTHITFTTGSKQNFKETGLSVAPGLGYLLGNLEASFRLQYNLTATGSHVYYYNFRLAYVFLKRKNKD
jgi:Outer membrane protein beta-barrel domain